MPLSCVITLIKCHMAHIKVTSIIQSDIMLGNVLSNIVMIKSCVTLKIIKIVSSTVLQFQRAGLVKRKRQKRVPKY